MSPVSIAIIGTGLVGPRHAQAVLQEPEARLSCIVDPNPAAKQVAKDLGTVYFPSIQEMLAAGCKPEAVIVCTPNHTHVPVSRELLDSGIHVLVEKPIAGDVETGSSLVEHAQARNLHLLVGHHRRFNRYILATKKLLSSNSLGRIIAVSGLWTLFKPLDYFDPPTEWRRTSTGGTILINLIHEVDILQYLFGPIVRVQAEQTISQRGFLAEEGAAILLRFESGVVGTFLLSDAVPSPHNFESGTGENPLIPQTKKDAYRIFGSEATLSFPDMQRWSYDGAQKKTWNETMKMEELDVPDEKAPFELQVRHLVQVLRGNETPACSGEDGVRAVAVCAAVKEAMRTGLPVKV